MAHWDWLIRNVNLASFDASVGAEYGAVHSGALAIANGRIAWCGPRASLPAQCSVSRTYDGQGAWLLPGFIDCHSHLVYGGDRADEFEQRLKGANYSDIARAGGGILSTVKATRAASVDSLVQQAKPRLQALMSEGVTGIEIKSGYGLTLASERRMLQAATRLAGEAGIPVQRTFLGAHALPPEFAGDADGYIDLICRDWLPALYKEGLVDAVDAFCEQIAFTVQQVDRLYQGARQLGVPVKVHAEQLSNLGGAALAAGHGGLSADHLEWLDADGIAALAAAGTAAVLLPGAFYTLRERQSPPIEQLHQAGVPVALATDGNPGSSPIFSIRTILNMACTLWGMTPAEALAGVTRNAARALGWQEHRGSLSVGKWADLVLWPVATPAALAYQVGGLSPLALWRKGQLENDHG